MRSPSPFSRRTSRRAWESSEDAQARGAAPATDDRRQPTSKPHAATAAAAASAKSSSADVTPFALAVRRCVSSHHIGDEPSPQKQQQQRTPLHRAQLAKPPSNHPRDDVITHDVSGGDGDGDDDDDGGNSTASGGGGDGSLLMSGSSKSSISIVLRAETAATAATAAPAASVGQGSPDGRDGSLDSASQFWATNTAVDAVDSASQFWATNTAVDAVVPPPPPPLAAAAAGTRQWLPYSLSIARAGTTAGAVSTSYTVATLPYAAARPRLCDDGDGAATAAAAAVNGDLGVDQRRLHAAPPLSSRMADRTAHPPLPAVALRTSSYDAPFAAAESATGPPACRVTTAASRGASRPLYDNDPLSAGLAGDAKPGGGGGGCAAESCSWGSGKIARHIYNGPTAGRDSNYTVGGGSSSRCSMSGGTSGGGSSSGNFRAAADDGSGGGAGGGGSGSPVVPCGAVEAAALPSASTSSYCFSSPVAVRCDTAPAAATKRVQLSISLISLSPSAPSANEASLPSGLADKSFTREVAAAAPPSASETLRSVSGSRRSSSSTFLSRIASVTSAIVGSTAAAVTVTAAAAAAATAAAAPVDSWVAVPTAAAGADLEDIDVIANILVAQDADDDGQDRSAGGATEAAAAAGAATAAAAGLRGGDDGEYPGALPPEIRRRLNCHLGRQRAKSIRCWRDLSYGMARHPPGHWLLGTLLLLLLLVGTFLFMAGQYDFVRPVDLSTNHSVSYGDAATALLSVDSTSDARGGPSSLRGWLAFWRIPASRTFSFEYLRLWGGRYCPDVADGQWWRWVTSLLLHQSSMHLVANSALLLVLSAYLESLFGWWRVLPVWLVAGVAGNMSSAFFESPCMLVVGSSGAVFGLLGAYVADAALNFESIPLLWLRLVAMAAVAALLVALQVTGHSGGEAHGGSTSHASHIGGFLAGCLLAVLLVPDFKAARSGKVLELLRAMGVASHLPHPSSVGGQQLYSFWQRHRLLSYMLYGIGVLVLALMLVALPLMLYLRTFHRMVCG